MRCCRSSKNILTNTGIISLSRAFCTPSVKCFSFFLCRCFMSAQDYIKHEGCGLEVAELRSEASAS